MALRAARDDRSAALTDHLAQLIPEANANMSAKSTWVVASFLGAYKLHPRVRIFD
jgi:hypothetical protein